MFGLRQVSSRLIPFNWIHRNVCHAMFSIYYVVSFRGLCCLQKAQAMILPICLKS